VIDDWIFYTNGRDVHLYTIHIDGTGRRQLNEDRSYDFVIEDDWIYYLGLNKDAGNPYAIYAIRPDSTERQLVE
jgi:hypothetical protein